MDLKIDQVFQRGITAHKEGRLQEAERLYRSVLKMHPKHPDAIHNLGLLTVAFNNSELALKFFKTALEINPKIEQFWISYIEALIRVAQFGNAKRALGLANLELSNTEKLDALNQMLLAEEDSELPSQLQLNTLIAHYQNGRIDEAESFALYISQQFPQHQFAWKVLGAILGQKGKTVEAVRANQIAVRLAPEDAEALNSLGISFRDTGRFEEAEASLRRAILLSPNFAEAYNNLGNTLKDLGLLNDAEASYRRAIALKFDFAEAHNNLGNTMMDQGRFEDATESYGQAITLKANYAEAHCNLANASRKLNRIDDARESYRRALELKYDFPEAHNNLGSALKEQGRLSDSEESYRRAIALRSDYSEAHFNLGVVLHAMVRNDEAEVSMRQAVALNSEFAAAHGQLGSILKTLGRLSEAEASCRLAIKLKPDYAEAHHILAKVLYLNHQRDSALTSVKRAYEINPKEKHYHLLMTFMRYLQYCKKGETDLPEASNCDNFATLVINPFISSREVDDELVAKLYAMDSRELDQTGDARFGSGKCSPDFNLFEDTNPIIRTLADDLTEIMKQAVSSEVYIYDSFFNILSAGGGTTPHVHLNALDKDITFDLGNQKYSLVYYLSVGDQDCSKPGILKLYDPEEDILPYKGMISIIPATRKHSAVYGGKMDRVMVGVNFYSFKPF